MRTLDISAGTNINTAANDACREANESGDSVKFNFNGIVIVVKPNTDPRQVLREWDEKCEERAKAYRESDEGKAAKEKEEDTLRQKQSDMRACLHNFDDMCSPKTLDLAMDWLKVFADAADYIGVECDKKLMAVRLIDAGFIDGFGVGEPRDFFDNKHNMGMYIMGQAINFLKRGMPPHQVVFKFIDEYKAMKA